MDFDSVTVKTLRGFAKQYDIRPYSRLLKRELFNKVQRELAARKIQKVFNRWRWRNKVAINDTDLFTMEPFVDTPTVKLLHTDNTYFVFDTKKIVDFMLLQGNFLHPYTNEPWTDQQLHIIAQTFFRQYPNLQIHVGPNFCFSSKVNLVEAKDFVIQFRQKERELQDQCEFFQNEIMTEVNSVVTRLFRWEVTSIEELEHEVFASTHNLILLIYPMLLTLYFLDSTSFTVFLQDSLIATLQTKKKEMQDYALPQMFIIQNIIETLNCLTGSSVNAPSLS